MTEIALRSEGFGPLMTAPMRLVEWADEARAAHALAESLCKTPFAGQFKGDALAATAAILRGAELGLTPVTSLGAFDLIQGTPAPKAVTLRALVQSHGHSVWVAHSSDTECIAKARRAGEDVEHVSKWTIDRAQRMGLTGKDNWKKQPAAMLVARATSEVCRLVAADLLLGIGYSSEEVRDDPGLRVEPPQSAPRTVAALQTSGPVERPVTDAPTASDAPGPEPDRITQAQQRLMRRLLGEYGLGGKDQRDDVLALVSDVIGRTVTTSSEMSRAEGGLVIEFLQLKTGELPAPDGAA